MGEVPLRDYVELSFKNMEAQLAAIEALFTVRFEATQRAVDKAEALLTEWKHSHNEFRQQILTERVEFAKQAQVDRIQKWVDTAGGRWQALTIGSAALSIVTMLLMLGKLVGLLR